MADPLFDALRAGTDFYTTLSKRDITPNRFFADSVVCEICGKLRGIAGKRTNIPADHSKCSAIRQQRYRDEVERKLYAKLFGEDNE